MKNKRLEPWMREVREHFESLIEHTDFGTLASRLELGHTQAQYLLHVKEADNLTIVAARLDQVIDSPEDLTRLLSRLMEHDSVRFSAREPQDLSLPGIKIDHNAVPSTAEPQYIRLGHFHIVHTPDVFDENYIHSYESCGLAP